MNWGKIIFSVEITLSIRAPKDPAGASISALEARKSERAAVLGPHPTWFTKISEECL